MHTQGSTLALIALAGVLVTWILPGPARGHDEGGTSERLVTSGRLAEEVAVREVRSEDDVVSGVLVNLSPDPVEDVRIMIRDAWLWNDEFHPGDDDLERTVFHVVPGEIPPGGQAHFSYRRDSPPPRRPDGRFETEVEVVSLVQIGARPPSAAAPR
jgi:hypothetical protein